MMWRRVRTVAAVAFLLGVFSMPAQGAFKIRTVKVGDDRYLLLEDIAKFYGMAYRAGKEEVVLRSRYSRLAFPVGDRRATINGVRVSLCEAVRSEKGHPCLSEVDFRRTLDPLLRTKVLAGNGVRRIVLDPGHGGKDPGAEGATVKEKEVNLQVAKLVAAGLRRRGYKVYLTRASDKFVPLATRVAAAAKVNPDLFVSLHANSATASANGIETFAVTPKGTRSTHSDDEKKKATPGNLHDRENIRLAYELQRYLLHFTKGTDRGVKRADFVVIRDCTCPSALVEMGFLSNSAEHAKLATSLYRRRLATGIANGIVAYDKALRAR
jgi:N-acetylmuramoyl-L-alanine amidase